MFVFSINNTRFWCRGPYRLFYICFDLVSFSPLYVRYCLSYSLLCICFFPLWSRYCPSYSPLCICFLHYALDVASLTVCCVFVVLRSVLSVLQSVVYLFFHYALGIVRLTVCCVFVFSLIHSVLSVLQSVVYLFFSIMHTVADCICFFHYAHGSRLYLFFYYALGIARLTVCCVFVFYYTLGIARLIGCCVICSLLYTRYCSSYWLYNVFVFHYTLGIVRLAYTGFCVFVFHDTLGIACIMQPPVSLFSLCSWMRWNHEWKEMIPFDWHSWTGLVLFLSKRTDFPSSNKPTGAPGKSKTLLCSGAKASEVSVARLTQIHCWWEKNNYRWDIFIAKELAESPQTLWRHITVAKLQSPSHAVMRTVKMPQINNSRLQLPSTLDSINLSSGLFSPACGQNQTLQRFCRQSHYVDHERYMNSYVVHAVRCKVAERNRISLERVLWTVDACKEQQQKVVYPCEVDEA